MLSLGDIHRLEAAQGWLARQRWANCSHELERIDYNNRDDARVYAIRWSLYNQSEQHVCAANVALEIQRRFPHEVAGYVWRAISLHKLGSTQQAYDELASVALKFDGAGIVPCVLSIFATELKQHSTARNWLMQVFMAPDGRELSLRALEEKSFDSFWRKTGEV